MNAADIMTKDVISIRGSATVAEAVALMKTHGLRALIVDRRTHEDAYGIVTETDVVYKVAAYGTDPKTVRVYEIMTKPCVVVNPELSVEYVARLFAQTRIRRAPVIKGELLGIISVTDILTKGDFVEQPKANVLDNMIQEALVNARQICGIEGLELLPGDIELYDEYLVSEKLHQTASETDTPNFEAVWNEFEGSLIKNILAPVLDEYDFIILDCAPGYNLLTRSGIAASDFYLLPARPEPLSVVGMQLLERRIARLKESHKASDVPLNINLIGVVFILSGGGLMSRYYNQVMRRVQTDFQPQQLFQQSIPMDVNVAKAVDSFMPVVTSMPNTAGSKAFVKLTQEFLGKVEAFAAN